MEPRVEIDQRVAEHLRGALSRGEFERRWVDLGRVADRLRKNPSRGQRIATARIPAMFGPLGNLWRMAMPGGWRMLYSLSTARDGASLVRIVWVGDHRAYDRLFGYS